LGFAVAECNVIDGHSGIPSFEGGGSQSAADCGCGLYSSIFGCPKASPSKGRNGALSAGIPRMLRRSHICHGLELGSLWL
jgi:hypothetical protein